MKKILFLVTQSEFGGAQRYIFETARGLDKTKYRFSVAAGQGDGELFQKLNNINIPSIKLEQMKRTPWPWQIILSLAEILSLLKKEKPDVLFLCSTTAGILGSLAAIFSKTKVVYRIGGWAFQDPRAFWKNWFVLLAEQITSPFKDIIIVNSETDRALALKHRIVPNRKLVKIYNGIDKDSLSFLTKEEARRYLSLPAEPIVGTVANFYKTKGLSYLVEAAKEVAAKFFIIGDGQLRAELEALIKKRELKDKVILAGRIPDAYRYLKAFDLFVLPSLKEGFPWIVLEAEAAQVPVLATEVGALPEILEKEYLVKPGNAQELSKKINWMLEHPAKTSLKKDFTSQRMVRETTEVLERISA